MASHLHQFVALLSAATPAALVAGGSVRDLVLDEARQHGQAHGITVPVAGARGTRALLSELRVAKRRQAVVRALSLGLIVP